MIIIASAGMLKKEKCFIYIKKEKCFFTPKSSTTTRNTVIADGHLLTDHGIRILGCQFSTAILYRKFQAVGLNQWC